MQTSFLSHAEAAVRNRNTLLHFVKDYGPISRTDIWDQLDISRASVTQIIRQLQESNLILEVGEGESTGGRKPRYIVFNGDAKKLYAFDWTTQTLALLTLGGKVLYEQQMHMHSGITPVAFAAALENEICKIDQMQICPSEEIIGFGVALPGLIDAKNSTVSYSVELGWQSVNLNALFSNRFSDCIYLERTGNIIAMGANSFGESGAASHLQLFLLSADGIGVSTIVHGDCQHGANYMYGELGHIKLPSSVICSCGQQGCLEAVVSDCLIHSNGQLTDGVLEYLSIGVSAAINITDCGTAILVGSYVDQLTQQQRMVLEDKIRSKLTGRNMRKMTIRFSSDIKMLSMMGLSAYVFNQFFAIT